MTDDIVVSFALLKTLNVARRRIGTPLRLSVFCGWRHFSPAVGTAPKLGLILALRDHPKGIESVEEPRFRLAIDQHGDRESSEFWEGLPKNLQSLAFELYQTECEMKETIVICHSEPGAWNPPLFQTLPCPPTAYQNFKAVIGRTMFETKIVKFEHVNRCNAMDYVWVPSKFHIKTFTESGVDPSKLVKIIQSIHCPPRYRISTGTADSVTESAVPEPKKGSRFQFQNPEYKPTWLVPIGLEPYRNQTALDVIFEIEQHEEVIWTRNEVVSVMVQ